MNGVGVTPLKVDQDFYNGPAPGCRDDTLVAHRRAVERVITAARERLCEPLSLRDMSRIAYISPFHFNRVFHQVTGLPPTKFIGALRLETAKRLLLTSTRSVTDICYEVGYSSIGTFTTRFTQLVGLGPREFRRLSERVTPASVASLCADYAESVQADAHRPSVVGVVASPEPCAGVIFVGLFKAHIPQSRPVGGDLLAAPGPFRIGRIPDGAYHLLAAALPPADDTLGYLLPDSARLFVGTASGPILVRKGRADAPAEVILRPMQLTDPPLLISLPFLLADALHSTGA